MKPTTIINQAVKHLLKSTWNIYVSETPSGLVSVELHRPRNDGYIEVQGFGADFLAALQDATRKAEATF